MFALALICSGQTASITATLAGQLVSEGFILWNISVSQHDIIIFRESFKQSLFFSPFSVASLPDCLVLCHQ